MRKKNAVQKVLRFLYLNTYGFLFLCGGIAALSSHIVLKGVVWLIVQGVAAFICFIFAYHLLIRWQSKIRQYTILMNRNKDHFRPETFKAYMEAPCGRKVVRAVLKDLGLKNEYRGLLIYKPPLKTMLEDCC